MSDAGELAQVLRTVFEVGAIGLGIFLAMTRLVRGQIQTHERLAALAETVQRIDDHVTKQNGSVAKHFDQDSRDFAEVRESIARLSGMLETLLKGE